MTTPAPRRLAGAFEVFGKPLLAIWGAISLLSALIAWWHDRWPDFAVFYRSASALRAGSDPYLFAEMPNMNSPLAMWLLTPLTILPETIAAALWLLIGLGVLILCARVGMSALTRTHWIWLLLAVFATQGGAIAVRQGQMTFFLMALMTGAWLADRRGHTVSAALALGALIFLKPFYGVFAIYFLWMRRWRDLFAMTVAVVACAAASLLAGLRVNLAWLDTLQSLNWQAHAVNVSLPGMASRLFEPPPLAGFPLHYTPLVASPSARWLLIVAGSAAIAAITLRAARSNDRDTAWASLSLSALLLSPLGWLYYLPVAAVPLAATAMRTRHRAIGAIGALLLCLPYAVIDLRHDSWLWTATVGSAYFWGVATLWVWATLMPDDAPAS